MSKKSDQPTSDPKGFIVKIGWNIHNRSYEIGIKQFLEKLGVEVTEEQIKTAVRKILNEK